MTRRQYRQCWGQPCSTSTGAPGGVGLGQMQPDAPTVAAEVQPAVLNTGQRRKPVRRAGEVGTAIMPIWHHPPGRQSHRIGQRCRNTILVLT
jgi:hypothetical protein